MAETRNAMTLTFFHIFDTSQYPIHSLICEYLPIGAIIALTRTCRRLSGLYKYLLSTQWNIHRSLRRFIHDPLALRSQMAKSDALISGSFALHFFDRSTWQPEDLDLYAQDGEQSSSLCKHLQTSEGYFLDTIKEVGEVYEGVGYIVSVLHLSPLTG